MTFPLTRSRSRFRFFAISAPKPGPPWLVADSAGTNYTCTANVKSSTGTDYVVIATVLSSTGTAYNPI